MRSSRRNSAVLALLAGAALVPAAAGVATAGPSTHPDASPGHAQRHVLLLSVDGLHQSDLDWYVNAHPRSALASLVKGGTSYSRARTTFPSDSFPGMVAQLTGAGPGTSGVYYDDTFNRTLLAPGTTDCSKATPGTEVAWTEGADRSQNPITLDAGQGLTAPALTHLPTNTLAQTLGSASAVTSAILKLTPDAAQLLDPALLPVDPATCRPLYPHSYIRVNTVFEVARAAGLRTAWSDKHAAYEILNGPSGRGVQDLFTPEINSVADAAGDDWTKNNALTQEYDATKVAAVLNEIKGFDHSGSTKVGTPAIFGMNFQSVSTAQKLPTSGGQAGGYQPDGTPGPVLRSSLDFVDREVGSMETALRRNGIGARTTVILSAKHGQSPIDLSTLRRVDDGQIIDAINHTWATGHPGAAPLVTFSVDDDGMLLWLSDRSDAAEGFVKDYLLSHSAPANTASDPKGTYSTTVAASGLTDVCTGAAADRLFGAPVGDPHAPDLVGIAQHGVVYTGGVGKIAEHGGDAPADRDVPLVVSGGGTGRGTVHTPAATTQIAPTILELLGLDPKALEGVRADGTPVLPGLTYPHRR
ncbi:alkaline phosphatase family protein [Terrabacter aerolatus]|uniref:Phosphodiesterase n=1 Tax=Terrabacter aerolatus TaxID=422442 RepID=A0A512D792_9MICO|nr:alkaline phosphatase family protein [Terrabacter aerolatus]GEO32247.1 phosphodiesterase [Terrabacter aerolatus]